MGQYTDFIQLYGGDLWGVIDKLDYLEDLGINGFIFVLFLPQLPTINMTQSII